MRSLVKNRQDAAETAYLGIGIALAVLLMFGGWSLSELNETGLLFIAVFAVAGAVTLSSSLSLRDRFTKIYEPERFEQTVREVVRSNG